MKVYFWDLDENKKLFKHCVSEVFEQEERDGVLANERIKKLFEVVACCYYNDGMADGYHCSGYDYIEKGEE